MTARDSASDSTSDSARASSPESRSDPALAMLPLEAGGAPVPARPNGAGEAPAIQLRDVRLSLGRGASRVDVLRGIDLEVARGEALGLVGPSGSGKSTLLMVTAGLERVDTGSVIVDGVDLSTLDEDGLARFRGRRVGIVFQSFHLIPTMTALENVAVPLELAGHEDAFERARAALSEVGLGERLSHYPAQLSGGEQQRVALARAVAPEPAILVADEPTGNLDESTGRSIVDLMFRLRERHGATLVLITHDPSLARACDRAVRLRAGQIEDDGRGGGRAAASTGPVDAALVDAALGAAS